MDRKKCFDVGHWRDYMRRRRNPVSPSTQAAMLACSSYTGGDACVLVASRPNRQKLAAS